MKVILILRMLISVPTIYCCEKPMKAKVMKNYTLKLFHTQDKERKLLSGWR